MKTLSTLFAAALLMSFSALQPASAQTKTMEVNLGPATVLTDANGMTLYIFVKDAPGKSNCNGRCAQAWPPLLADEVAGENFSIVTRDDGSKQVAYKEMPLYLWVRDENPGDTKGEGVGNVWLVARP